jgi:hypothetical protein
MGSLRETMLEDDHRRALSAIPREQIRSVVIELLKELVSGVIVNEPEKDADGDEWNNYVFDGEEFVDRILRYKPSAEAKGDV